MRILLTLVTLSIVTISCHQTYYIVRHAEKEAAGGQATMMTNDPPLSETGRQRAQALKDILRDKKIGYVYSTNTIRTRTTAEPVREYFHLTTQTYQPIPDSTFIVHLLSLKKNVLVVGHSNTVDDLVNRLGKHIWIPADLPDSAYDNLFIVRKKGKKLIFENKKYGVPTP